MNAKPNIVFIMADNLGWGELGCYGGGSLLGAPTPRIDALAAQGLKLQNYNVESDCVPTRSALMTGRHPIRTGCLQHAPAGLPHGLTRWEVTLPQLISAQGYATAMFGKWHLGETQGRLPTARGFDEWYGIPRTTDESAYTSTFGFDPSVVDLPYIMEGKAGSDCRNAKLYDLESRRTIDEELTRKSIDFIERQVAAERPFFLYVPLINMHYPTLAHRDFSGKSEAGDYGDCMMEMDHRVGQIVDAVDARGIADNTIVVFCSDNGPEFRAPWRGTAGPWSGTYHTAMEGSLRVPFIVRWPGRIAAGRVSNEIVHVTDIFTTLATMSGATVPTDRPIDGMDLSAFFLGAEKSGREGFCFYLKNELYAAKWRDWKLHFYWMPEVNDMKGKLESPYLFNLKRDPKEQTNVGAANAWTGGPIRKMIRQFQLSFNQFPNTPPGQPDPE
ncbi:arylsulfatase [Caenimonas aquaedulcis]|uniref:Arylsulfatase n=1 Tax=Caenimonas aquaedulcis TaxID=2793270 RepID=A0A931H3S8_9BURK|nr:arylsulfatase [Caenimonas aquaedulcis]MBG9387997.1 arylsulfatase [Caenimonas aquaedulcis]